MRLKSSDPLPFFLLLLHSICFIFSSLRAYRTGEFFRLFWEALDLLNLLFSWDAISEERDETTAKHKNSIQPDASAELDSGVYAIETELLCNWLALLRTLQANGKTDLKTKRE